MNLKVVISTGCAERRKSYMVENAPPKPPLGGEKTVSSKEVQERQDSFKLYNQRRLHEEVNILIRL